MAMFQMKGSERYMEVNTVPALSLDAVLEKNTVKGVNRSTDKLGIRVNKVNVCISEEMTGELGPD